MHDQTSRKRLSGIPIRQPDLRSTSAHQQGGVDTGSKSVEAEPEAELGEEGVEQPKLWEKQPWESNTAYQYFAEFFLPQPTPRNML